MKNVLKYELLILVIIIIIIVGVICFKQIIEKNSNIKPQEGITTIEKYKPLEKLGLTDCYLGNLIENKYYIIIKENIVYHKNELDKFIENVNLNIPDKIRIVQYEYKNKITIKDLEFYKEKFIVKIDDRLNVNVPKDDREIITNEYDSKNYKLEKESIIDKSNNLKKHYRVNLVSSNRSDLVYICNYIETAVNEESKFKIEFNEDLTKGRSLILSKSENKKYDYDIYSYGGTVNIVISNEKMSLRDALLTNKITIDEILEKAKRDADEYETIWSCIFLDGGSRDYHYNDYTIFKFNQRLIQLLNQENTLNETYNRDLYIGNPRVDEDDLYLYYKTL